MNIELSQKELNELFIEQLEFLECSANSYDQGFEGEVKKLAVTVRVNRPEFPRHKIALQCSVLRGTNDDKTVSRRI